MNYLEMLATIMLLYLECGSTSRVDVKRTDANRGAKLCGTEPGRCQRGTLEEESRDVQASTYPRAFPIF